MKLKKIQTVQTTFPWNDPENRFNQKYALVGKCSENIHMIFDAVDEQEAKEVQEAYSKIRRDTGYWLYLVDEPLKN